MHDSATSDYGDLIGHDTDDENERWDIEDHSEPVERYYQPPHYYPLCVGEVLAQRYRIEHKLGHGGFSTVWMAHDVLEEKNVALKICTAGNQGVREDYMNAEISRCVQDTSHLLLCSERFVLPGHHGHHTVLVFPLRGPSLGSSFKDVPMRTRMFAASQLLQALRSLHSVGIIHRDINSRNVMWDIISFDGFDLETKYKYLGRPQRLPLDSDLWKKGELVKPVKAPQNLLGERIFLGDFGLAIHAGTPVNSRLQAPHAYCAPERLHNVDPSSASDIWSYMCIFAELYLGFPPFESTGYAMSLDSMVHSLGPLPEQWWGYYFNSSKSNDSWYDQTRTVDPDSTLEALVNRTRPDASLSERSYVASLFAKGFCYLPKSRITAVELLHDDLFLQVMASYRL